MPRAFVVACESRLLQTSCTSKALRCCWIPSPLGDSTTQIGKSPLTLSPRVARAPGRGTDAGLLLLNMSCLCGWAAPMPLVPLPRGLIAWPSCNHTLHYRGRCRWNRGAHVAYVGPGTFNLCPDCWQNWARSVAGCPRRRSAPLQNDGHSS